MTKIWCGGRKFKLRKLIASNVFENSKILFHYMPLHYGYLKNKDRRYGHIEIIE